MTVLYHGTNAVFEVPDVEAGREGMDFGKGFYLTPSVESARKMAVIRKILPSILNSRE